MANRQIIKNQLIIELQEFLSQFESVQTHKIVKSVGKSKWNEIRVPTFRNFKVFVHQSNGQIMIAIPTHISGMDEVYYHVITEDLENDEHNGEYKRISQEKFKNTYDCNFINAETSTLQSTKITDLADMMVEMLPHIKKLKTKTDEDKIENTAFFSQIILEFLLKNSGKNS